MYPFVTLGFLWIAAPIAGYLIHNQQIKFAKALLLWTAALLLWYFLMALSGYQAMGEEGDYNAWTAAWWMLNFFVFQALRLPRSVIRDVMMAPMLAFIAGVCLWSVVIIIGNL